MANNSMEISKLKNSLPAAFKDSMASAKTLDAAFGAWNKAQSKANANLGNQKLADKADGLKSTFERILKESYATYTDYRATVAKVDAMYIDVIAVETKRSVRKKLENEQAKFSAAQSKLIAKLAGAYATYERYLPEEKPAEQEKEEETPAPAPQPAPQQIPVMGQPYYQQPFYAYPPQPQSVNVAPVTIDITKIVEDTVKSALEKFKTSFDARANEYLAALKPVEPIAIPAVAPAEGGAPASDAVLKLADKVSQDEKFVLDKLVALLEEVKAMTEQLTGITAACAAVTEKQKEAVASSRRVNEMQRSLSRELQGVQANQKVITQDQIAVTEAQTVAYEHQKTIMDRQSALTEAQKTLGETQKSLTENHAQLEKSVADLMRKQKSMINKQQKAEKALPTEDAPAADGAPAVEEAEKLNELAAEQ